MNEEINQETETTQTLEALDETQPIQEGEHSEQAEQQSPQESNKEINFRAMREAKERAERDRAEMEERVRRLEAQYKKPAPQPVEEEDDFDIAPDDFVEGKHYKKMAHELKALKRAQQESQQQTVAQATEMKLKMQYPDFDQVVNPANLERLRAKYPQIASTIYESQNLYDKASSAYTIIKELALTDTYQQDRQKAQINAAKPRSLTSISPQQGDSPISQANAFANGLTPDLQRRLRAEMDEARQRG